MSKELQMMTNGVVPEQTQLAMKQAVDELAKFERNIKMLKNQEEEIRKNLLKAMADYGVIKLETPNMVVTYIAPTESEYFDKTKFKKENPDLYNQYVSMREKKASVRIKVNN